MNDFNVFKKRSLGSASDGHSADACGADTGTGAGAAMRSKD